VESVQKYATVTGIMRNEHNFAGIILKESEKILTVKFKKFLIAGTSPKVTEVGFYNDYHFTENCQ
jgi:lipoprotein-releasing system permease protein